MSITKENTSLLCLFHHEDHASAALRDLRQAGVADAAITSISGSAGESQLSTYGMPDRDRSLMEDNLRQGAILIAVQAQPEQVSLVERIFGEHSAKFVDEYDRTNASAEPVPAPSMDANRSIPIVEEEFAVGKRTVDQGGVRVFRRVVEIPVAESVNLREEHVVIDRLAVDRPATEADLDSGSRVIELNETAEEVVLSKTAHVVEEVVVGKVARDRVEHIEDTVRRTQIEVEELPAETLPNRSSRSN